MGVHDMTSKQTAGTARIGDNFNKERLKQLIDEAVDKKAACNQANADFKGVIDQAEREGYDRKAFKAVLKNKLNPVSPEHQAKTNLYCDALGELPLFAAAKGKLN